MGLSEKILSPSDKQIKLWHIMFERLSEFFDKNEFFLGCLIGILFCMFLIFLGVNKSRKQEPEKEKEKGVVVVCKTCKGTGETEQDVNLLMAKAVYSMWFASHSRNCEDCKGFPDGEPCEVDKKKYKEIMDKYEKLGPKIDKAACPDCMGMGSYTQFKGYRFGRERD